MAADASGADGASTLPRSKRERRAIAFLKHKWLERFNARDSKIRLQLRWVPLQANPTNKERDRAMYEQRVEACKIVMLELLERMCLITRIVSRAHDGRILGMRVDSIADKHGLDQRRVERALHDLHSAGWIDSTQRCEEVDGHHRGHTAIRQISQALFAAIGLGTFMQHAAAKEYARRKGQPLPPEDQALDVLRARGQAWHQERGRELIRRAARTVGDFLGGTRRKPPD